MKLHELKKSSGRTSKSQRVGRWNSSRYGNYSKKGLKWQKARSWFSQHAAFEGGQTPLFMRLPKQKWFKRYFKLVDDVSVINLVRFQQDEKVKSKSKITKELLKEWNYIKNTSNIVKILGQGRLTKVLKFDDDFFYSQSAIQKIEKAGGSIKQVDKGIISEQSDEIEQTT